ncbi:MAG: hypothetical protein A3G58_00260 [Candidatus Colwellbacteria bacterium RIFCSPLOWO2_12_FULL_46_17]|uniref:Membrane fusion protein biotin-lipoyl like domain-containing protein n=1 Tax=Candidatus Colwellbacteria bacterium RIFCSPLOWO2_12_FULL_46_17 TaxID=1797695 RepID=A0A1G1ZF00_9BACT|nr:MAG: hypothetical protein A3G58_00260 [Candidatus Colwellbacteria bacterium RIFCSPLOWO2_12_FULL_46_17]
MTKKILSLNRKFIKLAKKKPILSIGIGIVTFGVIMFAAISDGDGQYTFVTAERRDIVQEVEVAGSVKAAEDVDLAFEEPGTISQVFADVGDEVKAGQTLVTLRNSDIIALLNQAEAQADIEVATLNTLTANTEQELSNSYSNALNTIDDALAKSEDAVRAKSSSIFSGSKYSNYYLTFNPCDTIRKNNAQNLRLEAELELERWNKELKTLETGNPSTDELDVALFNATRHLDLIQKTVNAINEVLATTCSVEDSTLDTARTNMATAQTNVSTAIDNINDLTQAIALNKISVADDNDVAAQEARVRAAEANADNYKAQLEKTIMRSPINGVLTRQEAVTGETAIANTSLVSVISASSFEVKANIPEVELAEVSVGARADITLDAYGEKEIFEAHIVTIDPAETIVGGVPNYKATLLFDKNDERIRSGMTANIRALGETRNSVIGVPRGSIFEVAGIKKVNVLVGEGRRAEVIEVNVETGVAGSDGFVEIISGIEEGDRIVITVAK